MRHDADRPTYPRFSRRNNSMKRLFVLLICILSGTGISLSQTFVIYGAVREKGGKPLPENVNIFVNTIPAGSTYKGDYRINFPAKFPLTVKFTHIGYNSFIKIIKSGKDSLRIDVMMIPALIELDPIFIGPVDKPDTVIGDNSFFVQDFEFAGEDLVLLTSERITDNWMIRLVSEDQHLFSVTRIPVKDVLRLYKDFLGYINVICKEEIYRVKIADKKLTLQQLPKQDYEWMIMPCVDTIGRAIYFSNYRNDYPEFSYFAYNKNDSTKVLVRSVVDKDLALQYSFEYEFLKPREKLNARKLEQQTGIDKHEIAAYMTDFAHQRWFTPLYAPMFIIRDTVLIFDHYSDKIYKYNSKNEELDSVPISYHHPEKWKEWRRQLIRDESNDIIYGQFLKGGYTYLKEISIYTGEILSVSALSFQFVDKVKVKNGSAYYIYRPNSSLQTKFLYKEKVSVSN